MKTNMITVIMMTGMQVKKEKESGKNILWLNAGDFYQGITIAIIYYPD